MRKASPTKTAKPVPTRVPAKNVNRSVDIDGGDTAACPSCGMVVNVPDNLPANYRIVCGDDHSFE